MATGLANQFTLARAGKAIAIALATAFVLGGSLGIVAAQTQTQELPSSFQTIRPNHGDLGAYEGRLSGDWEFDEEDFSEGREFMRFKVGDVVRTPAHDGWLVDAVEVAENGLSYTHDPLESAGRERPHWRSGNSSITVHAESLETLAYATGSEESGQAIGVVAGLVPIPGSYALGSQVTAHGTALPSCLTGALFAAEPVSFNGEPMACRVMGLNLGVIDEDGPEAVAWRDMPSGYRVLEVLLEDEHSKVWLGFANEVPYPINLRFERQQVHPEELDFAGELTLNRLASGPTPVNEVMAPVKVLEPMARVPVGPYGILEDAGVDHPFSASEALNVAIQVQPHAPLAGLLEREPDAYVYHQDYHVSETEQRRERSWTFSFKGHDEALAVQVTEITDAPEGQDLLPEPIVRYETGEPRFGFFGSDLAPAPGEQPTSLPRAADLLEWQEFLRAFEPAPASEPFYGFTMRCGNACESDTRLHAGWKHNDARVAVQEVPSVATEEPQYYRLGWSEMQTDLADEWILTLEVDLQMGAGVAVPDAPGTPPPADAPEEAQAAWVAPPAPVVAGVAGIALLVAVLYWFAPTLKVLPVFGLFSRLRQSALLNHPKRSLIQAAIENQPGVHFKALQRSTEIANGTLRHHLNLMVQHGVIQERRGSGYTCYFVGSRLSAQDVCATEALKSAGARAVLEAVARNPGASGKDVGAAAGLSPGTVGYHVRKLRAAGLIDAVRESRIVHLVPTREARKALTLAA